MTPGGSGLGRILGLFEGLRVHSTMVAALEVRLFGHLAEGPATAAELAARAGISLRGTQGLLDAVVALGLVEVESGAGAAGRYRNRPETDAHLVPGRPLYVGDEHAALYRTLLPAWTRLTEIVRTGRPAWATDGPETLAYWAVLTPMIARWGRPVADAAVQRLGLRDGPVRLLDVGGGAAALYSLALLTENPEARAAQVDWPHINRQAEERLRAVGCASRFRALDGDFHSVDLGAGEFDVVVLSNLLHQESPAACVALIARVRTALAPGGRLVISEFVVDDGRAGPPGPLLSSELMLLYSEEGRSYTRGELARMIHAAGLGQPDFHAVDGLHTLVVARAS